MDQSAIFVVLCQSSFRFYFEPFSASRSLLFSIFALFEFSFSFYSCCSPSSTSLVALLLLFAFCFHFLCFPFRLLDTSLSSRSTDRITRFCLLPLFSLSIAGRSASYCRLYSLSATSTSTLSSLLWTSSFSPSSLFSSSRSFLSWGWIYFDLYFYYFFSLFSTFRLFCLILAVLRISFCHFFLFAFLAICIPRFSSFHFSAFPPFALPHIHNAVCFFIPGPARPRCLFASSRPISGEFRPFFFDDRVFNALHSDILLTFSSFRALPWLAVILGVISM